MSLGAIYAFRDLPAYFGFDMDRILAGWEVLLVVLVALVVMVALVYLAGIAWLLFAKIFFTKAEVSRVVFYGPTTVLERWLVDRFFPDSE